MKNDRGWQSESMVHLSQCIDGISIDTLAVKGNTCYDWIAILGELYCMEKVETSKVPLTRVMNVGYDGVACHT